MKNPYDRTDPTRAEMFARFGQCCFEWFWNDAEPGDLDASDLQEKAVECGLLRKRKLGDDQCSCDEISEDCECLFPTVGSKPTVRTP